MDRVFPENMNAVDVSDVKVALSTHDSYIRYMRERIEYTILVLTKLNSGTSLADLASRMSALELRMGSLTASVNSLGQRVNNLEQDVGDINTILSQI